MFASQSLQKTIAFPKVSRPERVAGLVGATIVTVAFVALTVIAPAAAMVLGITTAILLLGAIGSQGAGSTDDLMSPAHTALRVAAATRYNFAR
jgi:hypothetical protein